MEICLIYIAGANHHGEEDYSQDKRACQEFKIIPHPILIVPCSFNLCLLETKSGRIYLIVGIPPFRAHPLERTDARASTGGQANMQAYL